MTKKDKIPRIETGVRNLDAILEGGLPKSSSTRKSSRTEQRLR